MTLLSPCCCSLKNNFGQVFQFCIKFNKSKAIETHFALYVSGVSSLGVPGVPWHTHTGPSPAGGLWGLQPPQFLANQLTLSQPGGANHAHHSTTSPPGFSDLTTGLPYFGRSVNPISTKGDRLLLAPPDFQTFRRPCILVILGISALAENY